MTGNIVLQRHYILLTQYYNREIGYIHKIKLRSFLKYLNVYSPFSLLESLRETTILSKFAQYDWRGRKQEISRLMQALEKLLRNPALLKQHKTKYK